MISLKPVHIHSKYKPVIIGGIFYHIIQPIPIPLDSYLQVKNHIHFRITRIADIIYKTLIWKTF